jgi:hypothetical protein
MNISTMLAPKYRTPHPMLYSTTTTTNNNNNNIKKFYNQVILSFIIPHLYLSLE